jgi:predicted membrane-bound spermidine synthase
MFTRRILFLLFFISGFCSLVYQMVWTRLAFASFGIITPVLSVVLSVFMLGLAAGSWAGGRGVAGLVRTTGLSPIFFYAGAELIIGCGAVLVPKLFKIGEQLLLSSGQSDSFRYLFLSALALSVSILPWCVFMGATFPLMMAYVREQEGESVESFSYLYFANVLGAMSGSILTVLVLVEVLGFFHTLVFAAAGNVFIAAISIGLGFKSLHFEAKSVSAETAPALTSAPASSRLIPWILFSTGFSAMAMEVVWTRVMTPVLRTQVYSFAFIIFAYLGATFVGSALYRSHLRQNSTWSMSFLIALLAATAFLPIFAVDPALVTAVWNLGAGMYVQNWHAKLLVLASITPLCAVLGYLTPSLIDQYSAGQPAKAGKAYGINIVGCVLGPLFASYVLMPYMRERYALIVLVLPLLALFWVCAGKLSRTQRLALVPINILALVWALFGAGDFDRLLAQREPDTQIRRDYAAAVDSFGRAKGKRLLVNGIGMTVLTPATKYMVHLPMAFHKGKPESALIICFGMGTSFRSAMSWGVQTTVVELVPSVPKAFPFYHADAGQVLSDPKGRVVIDDGRRYMQRAGEKYDVIVVDPPPPVEAAGSSLLYTREFYELAKQHLKPNGILQSWVPISGLDTVQAILRPIYDSFPYVRCFDSIERCGTHLLASMEPIVGTSAGLLGEKIPERARRDILEWSLTGDLTADLQTVLSQETQIANVLNPDLKFAITDDQPFNEYFFLRSRQLYQP